MPSTVEQLSPSRVKMTVEVPFEDLKPSLDKAYKDIAGQVNIPGFRKGKVPPQVIDQRFGRGAVLQDAINSALPDIYGQAVQENGLVPLGEPEIDITKLEDRELVEFTAELDVRPDFDLPELSEIAVEVEPTQVNDERLEEQIQTLRERFATTTEVERAAAEGDQLVVDLAGKKNGEELDEATAEGITYIVGQDGMLEGLAEAATGLSAGESATFESELVGGPLRGERADITVTVQKVMERELPEVDDEFAQLVSEFDTVEEMRADLRESLGNVARLDQAAEARDKVLEGIIAQIDLELPEKVLADEIQSRHNQITQQLAQAGMSLDQYLEDSEDEAETAEEFWAEIDKRAEEALKAQLVLDKYADDAEVGVDQNDLTQHIMRKAQQSGTSPEQEAQHMMEHNHMAEWMGEIRRGKALAAIVEQAKVTDTDGNDLELSKLRSDGSVATDEEIAAAEAEAQAVDTDTAEAEVEAEADVEAEAAEEADSDK